MFNPDFARISCSVMGHVIDESVPVNTDLLMLSIATPIPHAYTNVASSWNGSLKLGNSIDSIDVKSESKCSTFSDVCRF